MRKFILFIFFQITLFSLTPQEALKKLLEGNNRFIQSLNHTIITDQNQRREALVKNQTPFAVILGCSDARVPPEILFDQGIGELFIIRVAGNVLGPSETDSLTYAINVLNSPLIVVLGHENCGAVNAVITDKAKLIPFVEKQIAGGIGDVQDKNLEVCTKLNVQHIVKTIRGLNTLQEAINNNTLEVVGAYYPFVSGQVELLKN